MGFLDQLNQASLITLVGIPMGFTHALQNSPTQEATPITILAVNSDHGLSFAGRKLGPWSEFPFLYRFTVLMNSGGSNLCGLSFGLVFSSFFIDLFMGLQRGRFFPHFS